MVCYVNECGKNRFSDLRMEGDELVLFDFKNEPFSLLLALPKLISCDCDEDKRKNCLEIFFTNINAQTERRFFFYKGCLIGLFSPNQDGTTHFEKYCCWAPSIPHLLRACYSGKEGFERAYRDYPYLDCYRDLIDKGLSIFEANCSPDSKV